MGLMRKTYRYCLIDRRGCVHCGCTQFEQMRVIDDNLAIAWGLSKRERKWLDGREGSRCRDCGMSKRVRMLLWSIKKLYPFCSDLKILHLNQTNALGLPLKKLGQLTETVYYPDKPFESIVNGCLNQDMCQLKFQDNQFDLVVHSETLEHLYDYEQALAEVQRVLKPGGFQVYTVPLLFSRRTRCRIKRDEVRRLVYTLSPSFHGCQDEFPVIWEFGYDFCDQRTHLISEIHFDNYWRNQTVFALVECKPS